jgi:hypothetical protein
MIDNACRNRLLTVKQSFTVIPRTKATSLTRDESIIKNIKYDR